jgi:hypothetical protein
LTGAWATAQRLNATAMLAAVDGRPHEAIADMREARSIFKHIGVDFDDATYVVLTVSLLPDEPEVRAWAEEVRPLLVELRAAPWLGFLDAAMARGTTTETATSAEARAPAER